MSVSYAERAQAIMLAVLDAIDELTRAHPEGMPLGPMYAHLMSVMSLDTFNHIIEGACMSGKYRVADHCLHRVG